MISAFSLVVHCVVDTWVYSTPVYSTQMHDKRKENHHNASVLLGIDL